MSVVQRIREVAREVAAPEQRRMVVLLLAFLVAFASLEFAIGHGIGWMRGDLCFPYLGCNAGAFGYDAVVHFVSGVNEGLLFAILLRGARRPQSVARQLLSLALFALCAVVAWELIEWAGDLYRVHVLRVDFTQADQIYFQPSRADTVGDMLAGGIGAWVTGTLGIALRRKPGVSRMEP